MDLSGSPISAMDEHGGQLIATGPAGFCFMHCDGGLLADAGSTVYSTSTAGPWQRQTRPRGLEHGLAGSLAMIDGLTVAVGSVNNKDRPSDPAYPDGTESLPMAWTTIDGTTWIEAEVVPDGYGLGSLVESGGNFVALEDRGFERSDAVIWTADGSEWTVELETHDLEALAAFPGGFAAYGFSGENGFGFASADGREWKLIKLVPEISFRSRTVEWIGDKFLGIGAKSSTFGNGICCNAAWTSADGMTWQEHPLPSGLPDDGYFSIIPFEGFALVATFGPSASGIWLVEPT